MSKNFLKHFMFRNPTKCIVRHCQESIFGKGLGGSNSRRSDIQIIYCLLLTSLKYRVSKNSVLDFLMSETDMRNIDISLQQLLISPLHAVLLIVIVGIEMSTFLQKETSANTIHGAGGASHTFSEEEKQAFSMHINFSLGHDPLLQRHLPLDPDSMELFTKAHDGLILCKLINLAVNDAIDERAINKKENMNVYQKTENQNLALNAAKAIGCQIINIGASDLIEGRPILILGLVWQVIKIQLLSQITLKNFPELVLLLHEGETMSDLIKLHPELILLRWLNYHLQKGGSSRVVTNFGSDLMVCVSLALSRLNC
jgi:hypothetical protein